MCGIAVAVGDGDVAWGVALAVGDGDVAVGDGDTCSEVTVGDAATVYRGAGVSVDGTGVAVWGAPPSSPVSAQALTVRATSNSKPRPGYRMSVSPAGP